MAYTLTIGDKHLSSWSLRPWLVMKVFGIDFAEDLVTLDGPDTAAQIAKRNPAGLVPALHSDDLLIWDSLAIIEYLADAYPDRNIWPADKEARAVARCASAEMHSGFSTLRTLWPMQFASERLEGAQSPNLKRDIARIDTLWRDCRARYGGGGDFLFGDFSAADAMFAPVVSRFRTFRGPSDDSVIEAYREAVWSLPAMKQWGEGARAERQA